jgi:hypothetical protein
MPTDPKKEHHCHIIPFNPNHHSHHNHQKPHHLQAQDHMRGPTGSPVNELALASLVAGDDSEEDEPEEGFGDEGEDDEEENDEESRHRSGSTDTDSPGKGRSSPSEHGPKSPPKIAVRGVHTVRGNKDSPQQPQNGGGTTARSGGGMTARTNAASVRSQVSPSRKAAAKASTKLVAPNHISNGSKAQLPPPPLSPVKPSAAPTTAASALQRPISPTEVALPAPINRPAPHSPMSPAGRLHAALLAASAIAAFSANARSGSPTFTSSLVGSSVPGSAGVGGAPGTAGGTGQPPARRANSIVGILMGSAGAAQNTGKIVFAPRCPISTVCAWVSGPPLDVLRKVTDITKLGKNKNLNNRLLAMNNVEQQSRKRRWWIILSDLKLYFFEQYGDPKPKLIADICSVTVSPRRVDSNCLSFVFPDQRIWQFEFGMLNEALSFEFAVVETQRCMNEGGSQFMRLEDVQMGRSRQVHGVLTVS